MAANATDILSVANGKIQLKVDDDTDAEITALVTQAIESAVAHVADKTGFHLLRHDATFEARPSSLEDSGLIPLPTLDIAAVSGIAFYQAGDAVTADPTGAVQPLPARWITRKGWTLISAPAGGWPRNELDPKLPWIVTVSRDYSLTQRDQDIMQAIVLMARQFYEQPEVFESNFAVNSLLGQARARRAIRAAFPPL